MKMPESQIMLHRTCNIVLSYRSGHWDRHHTQLSLYVAQCLPVAWREETIMPDSYKPCRDEFHEPVVVLQSEDRVFEEGDAVSFLVQERREVPLDVILSEIVRQLLKVKYSLRNLELVVIDPILCILFDTHLFIETRNAVFKFRHNRACLVYA